MTDIRWEDAYDDAEGLAEEVERAEHLLYQRGLYTAAIDVRWGVRVLREQAERIAELEARITELEAQPAPAPEGEALTLDDFDHPLRVAVLDAVCEMRKAANSMWDSRRDHPNSIRAIADALRDALFLDRPGQPAPEQDIELADVLAWAEGIHATPAELVERVTEDEWRLAARIRGNDVPAPEQEGRLLEALTPSDATWLAYSDEFTFAVGDNEDDGFREVYVPWTTIKEIMAAIRERAALTPERPGQEGGGA